MAKATRDVWAHIQLATITHRLDGRYGEGWERCFTKEVQNALFEAELLRLVMSQAMEKYSPAQEMVRRVQTVKQMQENT